MTRLEILEKLYDDSMNNVFCYSANYLMTIPKRGYEKEFYEAKEISEGLLEMIKELNS